MREQERLLWKKDTNITAMVCSSASGKCLKPMIVFVKNRPSGPYSRNTVEGTLYGKSPNGYMDEELFVNWFENVFIPSIAHVRPTLLILDGHGSHSTYPHCFKGN